MILSWFLTVTAVALAMHLGASKSIKQKRVKLGEPVVLKCRFSLHHEIFWLKVSVMEKPTLLMITRLRNDGKLTEVLNYNTTRYQGCLVDKFFGLKLFSVEISDLGSYYCGIVEGKLIEFGDGVHIYANIQNETDLLKNEAFPTLRPEERQILYPIFATVLGFGLLLMVLVIFIVHMMTCRNMN